MFVSLTPLYMYELIVVIECAQCKQRNVTEDSVCNDTVICGPDVPTCVAEVTCVSYSGGTK